MTLEQRVETLEKEMAALKEEVSKLPNEKKINQDFKAIKTVSVEKRLNIENNTVVED